MSYASSFKFWIKSLLNKKTVKFQTFTYYIPAPPKRQTSYREKSFDRIMFNILNQGYQIIDIKTESHHSDLSSGMWVIFLVKGSNPMANKFDFGYQEKEPDAEITLLNEISPHTQNTNT